MSTNPTDQIYTALLEAYEHFNNDLFDGTLPSVLIVLQRQAKTMGYVSPERWENSHGEKTHELAVNPEYFLGYPLMEVLQTLAHESVHILQHIAGTPGRRGYHNQEWADMMEAIGLIPTDTGRPGGKRTGEKVTDYAVIGGRFYNSALGLLKSGFILPWLDRRPSRKETYHHQFYDKDGAAIRNRELSIEQVALAIPLGASVEEAFSAIQKEPNKTPFETTAGMAFGIGPVLNISMEKVPTRQKYSCPSCGTNVWGKRGLKLICGDDNARFVEAAG